MAESDPTNESQNPERGRDPVEEALEFFERRMALIKQKPDEEFKLMDEIPVIQAALWTVKAAKVYRNLYEDAMKRIERYRENCARNAAYEMEHKDDEK